MPIEEKKQSGEALPNASPGSVITFTGPDGTPSLKDEAGVITPSATINGSPLRVDEQGSDPTPAADKGHYYSKDVGGVAEGFYQGDDGNPVQLTSGGGLNVIPDGAPVPVNEQGSDPTPVANKGHYYSKDVSGVAEAFYQGDDGNPVQLTSGGGLAAKSFFFSGATKLEGQVFWAGATTDNVFATIAVPIGTNLILSGKGWLNGANGPGVGLAEFTFSVTRASDGTILGGVADIAFGALAGGSFNPSLNTNMTATGAGAADLQIRGDASGDTELCFSLSYSVCTLVTHAIPGF